MENSQSSTSPAAPVICQTPADNPIALLGVYQEICKSHQAIDEFRMKLLGLLPLASLTGIFVVTKSDSIFSTPNATSDSGVNNLVAFIGVFAATFTLALFLYEIRGILRCHDLIRRGSEIENKLQIIGQFSVCRDEHENARWNKRHLFFNAKVAACVVYSVVFAAWIFLALHHGFGYNIRHCTLTALGSGLVLAAGVHWLINKRIAA